jgi:hypothetical protein
MTVPEFIEKIEQDREFQLQIAGEKYIHPIKPRFMKLDLDERLTDVFKRKAGRTCCAHDADREREKPRL